MFQFRSIYLKETIQFKETVDEFYDSYYGGRTEAFRIGKVNADVYDVNSLYPYAMTHTQFPDIRGLHKVENIEIKYFNYLLTCYEGMAKVRIKHKDVYYGYLPCRMKVNGFDKLVFPTGEFETTVNFNELKFAIDRGVVEVLQVYYVVYGNPVDSPFIDFINDNYKKRLESKTLLDKTIYKNIMNSLYGRFGMREKLTTTYYEDMPFEIVKELQDDDKYYELKLFNKDRADCYLITENEKMKNSFFSIPTYSSYITSTARILLLKALINNEHSEPCYCDTDSVFLNKDFYGRVSDAMGDFKKEDKKVTGVYGLKNYTYINGEDKEIAVIKGISKGAIRHGNSFLINKYYKTKQALKNNREAGESYQMIKELKHIYDKRILLPNGNTKPIKL
jgi:hypothetical protein